AVGRQVFPDGWFVWSIDVWQGRVLWNGIAASPFWIGHHSYARADFYYCPVWLPFAIACGLVATRGLTRNFGTAPRCLSCGYDLSGNTSGMCPECGRTTPQVRDSAE